VTQQSTSQEVSVILYGIFSGVGMMAWVLIEYALGFHTTSLDIGEYSGYFSILIPIIFIYTALSDYQTKRNRAITFIEGINIGFKITLISALLFALFFYCYNKYINPDWIDLMIDWQRKKLILSGATNDQIEKFVEQNRYVNTAMGMALMEFFTSMAMGVIITLVEIPIVKKFSYSKQLKEGR
jgi:hypothetical protein